MDRKPIINVTPTADEARTVACPQCGVRANKECVNPLGQRHNIRGKQANHALRAVAWRNWLSDRRMGQR